VALLVVLSVALRGPSQCLAIVSGQNEVRLFSRNASYLGYLPVIAMGLTAEGGGRAGRQLTSAGVCMLIVVRVVMIVGRSCRASCSGSDSTGSGDDGAGAVPELMVRRSSVVLLMPTRKLTSDLREAHNLQRQSGLGAEYQCRWKDCDLDRGRAPSKLLFGQ